jgi:hypothetical protein
MRCGYSTVLSDQCPETGHAANVARMVSADAIFDRESARGAAARIRAQRRGMTLGGAEAQAAADAAVVAADAAMEAATLAAEKVAEVSSGDDLMGGQIVNLEKPAKV